MQQDFLHKFFFCIDPKPTNADSKDKLVFNYGPMAPISTTILQHSHTVIDWGWTTTKVVLHIFHDFLIALFQLFKICKNGI
jgi:hypothetical protein